MGAYFAVDIVARKRSFQNGAGMWAEMGVDKDLAEVGGGFFLKYKTVGCGLRRGCGNLL